MASRKNLRYLADRLDAIAARIGDAANDAKKRAAETILGDLVYVTPVDTSRALSNWQVGIGSPVNSKIDPHYFGEKGSSRNASASQALAIGRKLIAIAKPGQSIFISNSLPYIVRLNEGHSKQAPAGFVERSVLLGRKIYERVRLKLNG